MNTLASGRFWGFLKKNTETHVALRRNFSRSVSATDLVKVSKDMARLLVCAQKKNFGWGCRFLMSDVVSGGLFGHLHLALGANR